MQATRLATRAAAPFSRSIICSNHASTSYSLHTTSKSHASPLSSSQWEEIPIPVQAVESEAAPTPSSSSSTSKGKGKKRVIVTRELPIRKQFLLQQYKQILSSSPIVVFLRPSDFSVEEVTRLRVDLSLIPSSSSGSASNNASDINARTDKPRYLYMRPGLLRPLFEQMPNLSGGPLLEHIETNGQAVAALTLPALDPPTLKAALKAINKLSKTPNVRKIQAEAAAAAAAAAAGGAAAKPKPGAGGAKKADRPQEERLVVLTGIVDGKSVNPQQIKELSELPSLEQTLAQLVAVIETPARTIHSLVSRAGGQDLLRTLEGFKLAMEEKDKPSEA